MDLADKRLFRLFTAVAVAVLALGTTFYHYIEKLSWVDAYYFSVVTLATVGYGDITPQTQIGKIFTTFYIFAGVGIITSYLAFVTKRRGQKAKEHLDARKNRK